MATHKLTDRRPHAADVAASSEGLPLPDMLAELHALAFARRVEVFSYLPIQIQGDLAELMEPDGLTSFIAEMEADDRADLFRILTPRLQRQLEQSLGPEICEDVLRLAAYAEATAGAMMTTAYATLDGAMTTQQAIDTLRHEAPDKETIYRSYVLDDDGRLVGSVRLHALILNADTTRVAEIMEPDPISVSVDADRETAAQMIARYDVLALPVTDQDGRLVGIITHDDAADAMQAEMTEDFQRLSTVMPFAQSLREAGIGVLYSRRIVWLALLVFGNLFSGAGIAYFEDTILAYVSLVFFLPLLIDSSGNAGSQSATLMVRALATGDVTLKDWRTLIMRELGVATALGGTMAAVVFPVGYMRGGADIGLVVAATMFLVVIVGALVGMSLPFLLSRLRLDPATASGPLVTTISDAVGVIVYFSIATMALSL